MFQKHFTVITSPWFEVWKLQAGRCSLNSSLCSAYQAPYHMSTDSHVIHWSSVKSRMQKFQDHFMPSKERFARGFAQSGPPEFPGPLECQRWEGTSDVPNLAPNCLTKTWCPSWKLKWLESGRGREALTDQPQKRFLWSIDGSISHCFAPLKHRTGSLAGL